MAEIQVAAAAEFGAVLRKAVPGDVLRLAPGDYPAVRFGWAKGGPLTIAAADPDRPPRFVGGLTLDKPQLVTFAGVVFAVADAKDANAQAVRAYGGVDLAFMGCGFEGRSTGDGAWGIGVNAGEVAGLVISGCWARQLMNGFMVTKSSSVEIVDNDLFDLAADGVRYSATTSILIARNRMSFAIAKGAHSDGIQADGISASSGVVIVDNCIVGSIGAGRRSQGIFLGAPQAGLIVRGNLLANVGYHGITVANVTGMEISGNRLLFERSGETGDSDHSWIRATQAQGVIADNRAMKIEPPIFAAGNTVIGPATAEDVARAIADWMARWRAPAEPAEPEAPEVIRISLKPGQRVEIIGVA